MLTFHNDKKIKAKYVDRLKAHAKADEIIKGTGWNGGKGCAVGCTLENYSHKAYETELGIPEWLARLEDSIFEGLANGKAKKFAVDFLLTVPVGVNLDSVKWKFCAFILKENIERVLLLKIDDKLKEQVVTSIQGVLKLHEDASVSGEFDKSAARSAASAAWSAAWSAESAARSAESAAWSAEIAAESVAWSAERSAAWSAASAAWSAEIAARSAESAAWSAESAASAAWSAAWSAESAARSAESAAWSAERSAAFDKYAKELLRLLKNSKK